MSKGKIFAFFATSLMILLVSATAFAQGGDAAANYFSMFGMLGLSSAIAIGVAGAGAALGQGRAAAAALEGIARNPGAAGQMLTPLILSLPFMEALGIFAFVIAFIDSGKMDMTLIK